MPFAPAACLPPPRDGWRAFAWHMAVMAVMAAMAAVALRGLLRCACRPALACTLMRCALHAAVRRVARWRAAWSACCACALVCGAGAAFAHPTPESMVWIDAEPDGVTLAMHWPLNRLEMALGTPLARQPAAEVLPAHGQRIAQYVLEHVRIHTDGVPWRMQPPTLSVEGQAPAAELHVRLHAQAPVGVPWAAADAGVRGQPRRFTLVYDAIAHEVRTHRAQVYLRSDWESGFVGRMPDFLGEFRHWQDLLTVTLAPRRPWAGTVRMFQDGMRHIAQGADHLLFLLLLLVCASARAAPWTGAGVRPPCTAVAARWRALLRGMSAGMRPVVWHAVCTVTLFALGHSLTLALGGMGWFNPPVQWVEIAVAATIALAALHAWRPLHPHASAWVALACGLIHGQAFSGVMADAGLGGAQRAIALLALNAGIEAMQLLLVLLVLPALLVLARGWPRGFALFRLVAVLASLAVAGLWVVQRLEMGLDPFTEWPWLENGIWLLHAVPVVLWLMAAAAVWGVWRQAGAPQQD